MSVLQTASGLVPVERAHRAYGIAVSLDGRAQPPCPVTGHDPDPAPVVTLSFAARNLTVDLAWRTAPKTPKHDAAGLWWALPAASTLGTALALMSLFNTYF